MTSLPKPKPCNQDWLEMTPTQGGRICGACSKTIVDFSKMRWTEIEQKQLENNNSLCGMYSDKQLEHWGKEISAPSCSKFAKTAALLLSLAASLPSTAQNTALNNQSERTIIRGKVLGKYSETDSLDTLIGATVLIRGTTTGTVADLDGSYELDITNYIPTDTSKFTTIEFSYTGYYSSNFEINKETKGEIVYNPELNVGMFMTNFSVYTPTKFQRITWKISSWFRKK